MKNQDKIRVSSGEDLLAFIPHIVGHWPENSVVCIGMNGKALRATMRLDLPRPGMDDLAGFARVAATQLRSDRSADGCLLAFFAPPDWTDPQDLPVADTYRELRAAFTAQGMPVRDAWYVGGRHFRQIECANPDCCPWPGKSNAAITASFVNAELVYRGSAVQGQPAELVAELTAVTDLAFAGAVSKLLAASGEDLKDCGLAGNQLSLTLDIWEQALARWPERPGPSVAAHLAGSVGSAPVRDCVLVQFTATPELALAGVLGLGFMEPDIPDAIAPLAWYGARQEHPAPRGVLDESDSWISAAAASFSAALLGGEPDNSGQTSMPDWDRLDRAEELLLFLARAVSGRPKAPLLCMLGWIQWCKGRGSYAGAYLAAAQRSVPGYTLAHLLEKLLNAGYIAPWAKNARTAWHGRRDEAA